MFMISRHKSRQHTSKYKFASIKRTMLILVSWHMCVRVMVLSSYYFNMAPLLAEVTAAAYLFR